ncbi:MAG: holo-[acyl-carrier-protein] synthase [Deltaproteobacteria bacterium RIFCSPLOWO2_01_44_7]|nr:MAG: holo-[acyl-carrier-protein] synthase [Deltaproteobacteria bacterium RIFCSPHIGHO2_01_FULL_43_49]OGQ14245.1 MAG: holo-[acyl-carrier-protein] synthase [Deltaproteobacteria bacterium RIFCSPHIGHO2_02_FULL_44_53]OGQ27461.1 MAG: holo-[acyl-carrier-protein] synthase [Deltaproteobacteria bacterium RIFCSPHIGHO2_12_FULL_44_21]OGQ30709.1 MAG: holo-[acyl-carrier-protein] synthase [Deltaproteobacteria bacterium RIFCSPLOWO2_01_FULL_45_74]OGQ41213.1 MAG: holo-[acyl-carrier-protein] synthase [Deltaprote
MILGIGVDLVDVRRMEAIIFRWQQRFLRRLFTEKEIHYCNKKKNPAQRFATRYAAKEAFIKALYPKGQEGISMRDIEIAEKENRPFVNLYGKIKDHANDMGVKKIHLMLSHDGDYGIANVILES